MTDVLSSEPDFEVVGTAANGRIALAKLPRSIPISSRSIWKCPNSTAWARWREFREDLPPFAGHHVQHSHRHAEPSATLDALGPGRQRLRHQAGQCGQRRGRHRERARELVPKIKAFCPGCRDRNPCQTTPAATVRSSAASPRNLTQRINIVAIGVSTGGPNALPGSLCPFAGRSCRFRS